MSSPAPDEYSSHASITFGPTGDFDGDGTAESIIEHSHHASAHGTTFAYSVMLGGVRTTPSRSPTTARTTRSLGSARIVRHHPRTDT